jgi:tetratricopeptide (TPR) repeat protein
MCRTIIEQDAGRLGPCHYLQTNAMHTLSTALSGLGQYDESADLQFRRLKCLRAQFETSSPILLSAIFDSLRFLERAGRAAEGEAMARELTGHLEKFGGGHGETNFENALFVARFVSMQGRLDEAETIFDSLQPKVEGLADVWVRTRFHIYQGRHLTRRGRFDDAEQALQRALKSSGDIRRGSWVMYPDELILAFIELYEASGKTEEAEAYRQMCQRPSVVPDTNRSH